MAKTLIRYCRKCNQYTRQTYVGKLKEPEDRMFNCLATMATLGGYQIAKRLMDDSPKCYECSRCGRITKE